jgi:putative membrane protein
MRSSIRRADAPVASALAVLTFSAIVIIFHDPGPQARHMGLHILAMNVAAPVLAASMVTRVGSRVSWLWAAALGQIVLLWGTHLPAVQNSVIASHTLQAAVHGVLLLAALSFWVALLSLPDEKRWHAIPALLLTGKLVCLLAALLVFAPRPLYAADQPVDDQQLAGLLMITACPLSYLVAAVIIAVRSLGAPLPARSTS